MIFFPCTRILVEHRLSNMFKNPLSREMRSKRFFDEKCHWKDKFIRFPGNTEVLYQGSERRVLGKKRKF